MTLRTRWRPGDRFLVRHKDAAIVVVEKKAGVLSQATESTRGEDMLSLLRAFLGPKGPKAGLWPVHRLDRSVSGLLVYARRPEAQQRLIAQFAEHSVERTYTGAVAGLLVEDSGTFESWLVTDRSLRVYADPKGEAGKGQRAVTHWRVLERFERGRATMVEVKLETGLRNQIRVQFADAGSPVLGEKKYAGASRQGGQRLFLHAAVLGFVHPLTGAPMRFEAPLPPELRHWAQALRRGIDPRRSPARRR